MLGQTKLLTRLKFLHGGKIAENVQIIFFKKISFTRDKIVRVYYAVLEFFCKKVCYVIEKMEPEINIKLQTRLYNPSFHNWNNYTQG
jgi:hypothetical protein